MNKPPVCWSCQNGACRKRIRKSENALGSSGSEFEPSGESASDVSFESEAESLSDQGEPDISGIYDDADLEQYNQARGVKIQLPFHQPRHLSQT